MHWNAGVSWELFWLSAEVLNVCFSIWVCSVLFFFFFFSRFKFPLFAFEVICFCVKEKECKLPVCSRLSFPLPLQLCQQYLCENECSFVYNGVERKQGLVYTLLSFVVWVSGDWVALRYNLNGADVWHSLLLAQRGLQCFRILIP